MKQAATNEFSKGLNLDLHPIVTPNTVLTDNLNGTFITYNGNEFCLQNDRGNTYTCNLSNGFIPIGAKEHGGIIYIVSVNDNNETEIGTFPGIENWDDDNNFLSYSYYPLGNLYTDESKENPKIIDGKRTFRADLGYDITTPVTIEVQDSYDGSVNLIIIDGKNKPAIINSGFSVQPENKYKIIDRSQNSDTNKYSEDKLLEQIGLIRTSDIVTNIDLHSTDDLNKEEEYLLTGGQLKGGNYKFYIKFGDADYNQTDVVAETPGVISIFNGANGDATSISGTLLDERTDKMIGLDITGLNHTYSKIYIYYSREYSDTNGFRMTEYAMLNEPIDMIESEENQTIWITGYEQEVPINSEELNVDYHTVDFAKAETQQSNMLFLGNIGKSETTFESYEKLRDFSQSIVVTANFGTLEERDSDHDLYSWKLYYDVSNIYYKTGYFPGELYRFGIVYVFNDNSTSPVFNIAGGEFVLENGTFVLDKNYPSISGVSEDFYKKGVVVIPEESETFQVLKHLDDGNDQVNPIYLTFTIQNPNSLLDNNVKSWFVVRQKRIPNEICEGLSIKVDYKSHTPMIYDGLDWISQSFLSVDRSRIRGDKTDNAVLLSYDNVSFGSKSGSNTLSLDNWAKQFQYTSDSVQNSAYVEMVERKQFLYENGNQAKRALKNSQDHDKFNDLYAYKTGGLESLKSVVSNKTGKVWLYYTLFHLYINGAIKSVVKDGRSKVVEIHYWSDTGETPSEITIDPNCKNYIVKMNRISEISNSGRIRVSTIESSEYPYEYLEYLSKYGGSVKNKKLIAKVDVNDSDVHPFSSDALISLDPCLNSTVRSILDGTEHFVKKRYNTAVDGEPTCGYYQYSPINNNWEDIEEGYDRKLVFIDSDTAVKVVDRFAFSNVAGDPADASKFSYFTNILYVDKNPTGKKANGGTTDDIRTNDNINEYKHSNNVNLIRGKFCPYVGLTQEAFPTDKVGIYSVKLKNKFTKQDLDVRGDDNSEYYCISKRFKIEPNETYEEIVYGGDCFVCTSTIRIIRNFIDSTAPVSENIVDPKCWETYVVEKGYSNELKDGKDECLVSFKDVNLSDVNTVDLGLWITFRTLSNYNLGIRSQDRFHVDEMSLLGSARTFYPLNGASTATGAKMEESWLLNDGYNAVVGRKRYNLLPDVPYTKSEFSNRIIFSNVNVVDAYTNGYRTFQGLSYKDYDKQYGEITKLISWGSNILCVMEHGIGLIAINEKALMQTTTGEAIHIYGHGVLPDNMTIISQDYGSKYPHSVIRTPIGVYGIDTDARKIWRVSDKNGFETISDMKIETYLNDNLFTDMDSCIETIDIRTHYNAFKGDVMFTFYNTELPYLIVPKQIILQEDEEVLFEIKTNLQDITYEALDQNIIMFVMRNNKTYIKGKSVGNTRINVGNSILRKSTSVIVRPKSPTPAVNKKYLTNIPKDIVLHVGEIKKYSFVSALNSTRLGATYDERIINIVTSNNDVSIIGVKAGKTSLVLKYINETAICNVTVLSNDEPSTTLPEPTDPSDPNYPIIPTDQEQEVIVNEHLTVYLQKPRIGSDNGEEYPGSCTVYVTMNNQTEPYYFDDEVNVHTLDVLKGSVLRVRCSAEDYDDYDVNWTITQDRTIICPVFGEYVYLTIGTIYPDCAIVKVNNSEVSSGDSIRFNKYGWANIEASCSGYLPYYDFIQIPEDRTIDINLNDGDCYLSLTIYSYFYSETGGYQTTGAPSSTVVDYAVTSPNGDTSYGSCSYYSGFNIPVHIGDSVSFTITADNYESISGSEDNITGPTRCTYILDRSDYYEFRVTNIPNGESFVTINDGGMFSNNVLNFKEGDEIYVSAGDYEGKVFIMPANDVVLDVTEFLS